MVVVANMLHPVVESSKAVAAPVALAVFAWVLGLFFAERIKVSVQNIEPGECGATFAAIGLVLKLFGVAKKVGLRGQRFATL